MNIDVFPDGRLVAGGRSFRCALGSGGVRRDKREGDRATPCGRFPLRRIFYRADRVAAPETALPSRALTAEDGWCDAPGDPAYNQLVRLPCDSRHETLWRDDHVYDVIAVLGYNDDPPVAGRGSAIFLHVARDGYAATEGCVALALPDLLAVLRGCGEGDTLTVHAPQ